MAIFFCDLDDTLLNSEKQISPTLKEALDGYVERGNRFVISTGRPLAAAKYLRDHLQLLYPHSYMNCYNGAMVFDNDADKAIFRGGLPFPLVSEILALADAHGIYVQAFRDDMVVAPRDCEELSVYLRHSHMQGVVEPDLISALDGPPCKMLGVSLDDPDGLRRFADAVRSQFGDEVLPMLSAETYLELSPASFTKGDALQILCDHLHIPVSESIAAGDEENDIPALRAAGFSIAMCNAKESVKAVADVITKDDNDHDGLLPYFQ